MYFPLFIFVYFGLVGSLPTTKTKEDVRIVDGEDIDITSAPYQVSLIKWGQHSCGGSIISSDLILTAAHCVAGTSPRDFSVRVGSSSSRIGGQLYPVGDMIWHPNFTFTNMDSDVALLWLSKPLKYSKSVIPIEMVQQGEEIKDGVMTMVSGWGSIMENGYYPTTLQMVKIPIVSFNVCDDAYSEMYTITPTMLCAGFPEGGKDSCQGDSGGPMVYNGKLVGVVSWGLGCARPTYPGVYAKLSVLRDWIDQNIVSLRRNHVLRNTEY